MSRSAADFDLPDVGLDFVISPSAPEQLQDFVAELLWYLYSPDRGGQIDEYCMWTMGGCWVMAQALHDWMGHRSSLEWVVGRNLHKNASSATPQHVVLKVGDFYIDGNGLYTREELIESFGRDVYANVSLKPFDPIEARTLNVYCDRKSHRQFVRDLRLEFGDGPGTAELAFL